MESFSNLTFDSSSRSSRSCLSMGAHSTAVEICQHQVGSASDVFALLRQLQDTHLRMHQQLQQLVRCEFLLRLQQQRRIFERCVALETKLRQLQHKHNRQWGL